MLIVRVELHSAITGEITEIARALIYNDGHGTITTGDYGGVTFFTKYPRLKLHVWNLVSDMLVNMGYGSKAKTPQEGWE